MLSLQQCRKLLGEGHAFDDEQLRRDTANALYGIAEIACDEMRPASLMFEKAKRLAPQEDWERIGERAAIYEHEAGLSRDEAERLALGDYLRDEVRNEAGEAVIYVRVSTKEQVENLSLATQERAAAVL